jgi:PKD repeat protein
LASWFWTWGDGSTSNLRNPGAHTYYASNAAKSYTITLTVWNNAGGFNTSGIVLIPVK